MKTLSLTITALLLSASIADASSLRFSAEGGLAPHLAAVMPVFDTAVAKLPPELVSAIPQSVSVGSLNSKHGGDISKMCSSDGSISYGESHAVLGTARVRGSKVELKFHIDLLAPYYSRSGCTQTQLAKILERTLIHELAHIYDRSAQPSRCKSDDYSYSCLRKLRASDDAQFLLAAGFKPVVRNGEISSKRMNVFFDRSPRSYENINPQEYFAVNFEFFILDPEYKCRRPGTSDYYQRLFNFDPYPLIKCESGLKVLSPAGNIIEIDLNRIYQVHYMHAASTQRLQSMWGHSQLRLIICAPGRALSSACLNDVKHHIAIDFTAIVEGRPSIVGGITGKFPTGINFRTFTQLEADTVIRQDRSITSLPIEFSRSELNSFVKLVVEKYWGQVSKYKFVVNNCATQTLFTILSAVANRPAVDSHESTMTIFEGAIITPNWISKYLKRVNLISRELQKINDVNIFRSPSEIIAELGDKVIGNKKLKDFVLLANSDRVEVYKQVLAAVAETEKPRIRSLYFEIEQIVAAKLSNKSAAVASAVHERVMSSASVKTLPPTVKIGALNSEWDGYGIPQALEQVREALLAKRNETVAQIKYLLQTFITPQEESALAAIDTEKKSQEEIAMALITGGI